MTAAFGAVACLAAGVAMTSGAPAGSATTSASSQLHGVSCVSATSCFAVGESLGSAVGTGKTLIERWNGESWSIVASPNPAGSKNARLFGVSCSSATSCFAVGNATKRASTSIAALVERWNGKSWSILATPKLSAAARDSSLLGGISCTSTSFCVAAGTLLIGDNAGNITGRQAVLEQWNGKSWSILASPTPKGSSASELGGVSCTSPTACFAVGDQYLEVRPPGSFAEGSVTLTERWDGKAWTVLASPSPTIGAGAVLASVSCTSKTSCLAAGSYAEGDVGRPGLLTERWNGKSWSLLASHTPSRAYTALLGVSCTGTTSCMTTGWFSKSEFNAKGVFTLTERWNGAGWSVVASPSVPSGYSSLDAVACVNAASCVAVGHSSAAAASANRTLVEQWNGTKWSSVASANPSA